LTIHAEGRNAVHYSENKLTSDVDLMDAKTFVISRANELGYFPEESDMATIVHNAAMKYARR
jgi:hypothetical protein